MLLTAFYVIFEDFLRLATMETVITDIFCVMAVFDLTFEQTGHILDDHVMTFIGVGNIQEVDMYIFFIFCDSYREYFFFVVDAKNVDWPRVSFFNPVNVSDRNWAFHLSKINLLLVLSIIADAIRCRTIVWMQMGQNWPNETFLVFIFDVDACLFSNDWLRKFDKAWAFEWVVTNDVQLQRHQVEENPATPRILILSNLGFAVQIIHFRLFL